VGKSSLINNLLNRRGLVKTSAEPGKTRLVNFFLINEKFILTDLPGYGFARGDKDEVRRWKPMIEEYIGQREELRALVHIMDIRRIPDEDGMEGMMMEFALHADIPHILVANKSDKLSHSACLKSEREIEKALGKKPIIYSAKTGAGKEALWKELYPLLGR
jgi:GTP-binding protein